MIGFRLDAISRDRERFDIDNEDVLKMPSIYRRTNEIMYTCAKNFKNISELHSFLIHFKETISGDFYRMDIILEYFDKAIKYSKEHTNFQFYDIIPMGESLELRVDVVCSDNDELDNLDYISAEFI